VRRAARRRGLCDWLVAYGSRESIRLVHLGAACRADISTGLALGARVQWPVLAELGTACTEDWVLILKRGVSMSTMVWVNAL
jgi:hypothetical protein